MSNLPSLSLEISIQLFSSNLCFLDFTVLSFALNLPEIAAVSSFSLVFLMYLSNP